MKKENVFISFLVLAAFAFAIIGSSADRKAKYKIDPEYIMKHIHDKRN